MCIETSSSVDRPLYFVCPSSKMNTIGQMNSKNVDCGSTYIKPTYLANQIYYLDVIWYNYYNTCTNTVYYV